MTDSNRRVVLVTGGARGIGRGIAAAFLAAGDQVMIADLGSGARHDWNYALSSATDLVQAVAEAEAEGDVRGVELDVTDAASCERAVADTLTTWGRLDVLVNNAGVVQSGPIEQFAEADWDRVFAVNTKGLYLMTRAALPALRAAAAARGDAAVINVASVAGKRGYPNMAAYCGSKFAAIGITQSLAAELAPERIRVNAICPGVVGTSMWFDHLMPMNAADSEQGDAALAAALAERLPLGRPQTTGDMGHAARYLAEAVNVTGVSLSVAGGFEMN